MSNFGVKFRIFSYQDSLLKFAFFFSFPMAAQICNTNRLVQRLSVFVTEFIRKTYGFLTPDHVSELRNLRNEIEDNFPACSMVTAPWKEDRKRSVDSENDTESELDLPPIQKRPRLKSDSTPEGNHPERSMYKDFTSPESSDPFTTPVKKSNDSEWTASTQEESDSDKSSIKEHPQRRVQVPFSLYNKIKEMFYPSGPRQMYIDEKKGGQAIVRRALN